ncbi:hypothetical protein GQ42DRAFT_162469 [Ramicandelaber brevisporus]|nr:hypothetical protein GQ42DRAFT_162469 [Ramicandelaber brevisporus]
MTVSLWRFGSKKIYFPNLIFKIVRQPKGAPSNEVAFRVPLHANKFDVRDYLYHLYGVRVSDVRTVIFPGVYKRDAHSGRWIKSPRKKKAIVTLAAGEKFEYPAEPNIDKDFGGKERELQVKRKVSKLMGWTLREPKKSKLEAEIDASSASMDAEKVSTKPTNATV